MVVKMLHKYIYDMKQNRVERGFSLTFLKVSIVVKYTAMTFASPGSFRHIFLFAKSFQYRVVS